MPSSPFTLGRDGVFEVIIERDYNLEHHFKYSRWAKDNLKGNYNLFAHGVSYFELEEDAMLFALRWV